MLVKKIKDYLNKLPQCYTHWDHLGLSEQNFILQTQMYEGIQEDITSFLCHRTLSCKTDIDLEGVWTE